MNKKLLSRLSIPALIALLASPIAGQELPVQAALVDERTVLLMPPGAG